jgi:ADP-heptose:LPS heptosyltransferase
MKTEQIKTFFLKKTDSVFGPFLSVCAWVVPARKKSVAPAPHSILIIRPGGIGDAVLLLPAISILKSAYPDAKIDVLAEKRNASIFLLSSHVRTTFLYDKFLDLAAMFGKTYDLVIDTEQWHRFPAIVARLCRAPSSFGYATNIRRILFSRTVSYSHDDYEVYSFLNLVEQSAGKKTFYPNRPFVEVSEQYTTSVRPFLKRASDTKLVAIFPGGSINERKWGRDRFHQVTMLLSKQGYGIVVVGGKSDVEEGEGIVSGISGALNLCGKLSLPETAAVLKESTLLITGDSGIMHIGYGLGMKVLALFGPGREQKWAPRGTNCRVINKHLPCSPCTMFGYTPKCKLNAECMKRITVEEVFAASMTMLK